MTLNEDRKQTKYGHKRWEHMTHTRQRTDSHGAHTREEQETQIIIFNGDIKAGQGMTDMDRIHRGSNE